jgi:hypothetical protein
VNWLLNSFFFTKSCFVIWLKFQWQKKTIQNFNISHTLGLKNFKSSSLNPIHLKAFQQYQRACEISLVILLFLDLKEALMQKLFNIQ